MHIIGNIRLICTRYETRENLGESSSSSCFKYHHIQSYFKHDAMSLRIETSE